MLSHYKIPKKELKEDYFPLQTSIENSVESEKIPLVNDCCTKKEDDIDANEIWREKYNQFLQRTSFKNLKEEKSVFLEFKFIKLIVQNINEARTNCLAYSKKIDEYKDFIKSDQVKMILLNKKKSFLSTYRRSRIFEML